MEMMESLPEIKIWLNQQSAHLEKIQVKVMTPKGK
jgi:hypothetical protein